MPITDQNEIAIEIPLASSTPKEGQSDAPVMMRGRLLRSQRPVAEAPPPVICLPGLTRNAEDFADLAPELAQLGHDVYRFSLRGRGASDRDPNYLNYHPVQYRDDILAAMNKLAIDHAIFVGTSLGGIITMLLAEAAPARLAGAVINDVGPELAPEGIMRIAAYAAKQAATPRPPAQTWEEAIAIIRDINEIAFPDRPQEFWLKIAMRTFRETPTGLELDYDPLIGRALVEVGAAPDLWPGWKALGSCPTLLIRGALSDLLSPEIVEKMNSERPGFAYCEVPTVGHAPFMTEPESLAAIRAFLS